MTYDDEVNGLIAKGCPPELARIQAYFVGQNINENNMETLASLISEMFELVNTASPELKQEMIAWLDKIEGRMI